MSSTLPRLVALAAAFVLLGLASFWLTRQYADIAPGQSGLALGMTWLKHEYRLDDATFEKVTEAHSRYFRECAQRCHELEDINRHFLSEVRGGSTENSDLDAIQILQEKTCHDCRLAMIEHVHEVAALMPEECRRRFIADVQGVLGPAQARR